MLPPLLVPAQTLPVAELAGDWNGLGFERDDSSAPYAPSRVKFTLDATGKADRRRGLHGYQRLLAMARRGTGHDHGQPRWPASTLTDSSGVARAVAFKGTDGQITAVIVHTNGILIATKAIRPRDAGGQHEEFVPAGPHGLRRQHDLDGNGIDDDHCGKIR